MITKLKLKNAIKKYLLTQQNTEKDEWYGTDREIYTTVLEDFMSWFNYEYKEDKNEK